MAKVFLDTNILIYSVDRADPEKQRIAIQVISEHAQSRSGVISTQVLQEFYSAATRKLGVEPLLAKQHLQDFRIFDTVTISPDMIEEAVDCSILHQVSFWDSLILTAAQTAGCNELLSEDLNASQTIKGVTIHNPFTG